MKIETSFNGNYYITILLQCYLLNQTQALMVFATQPFLWQEDPEQRIGFYEYTREVCGAKTSRFSHSVRTPQEAIEIYQKTQNLFSKAGFYLTKLITSDEEVRSQIPESDKSMKVLRTFKAEP